MSNESSAALSSVHQLPSHTGASSTSLPQWVSQWSGATTEVDDGEVVSHDVKHVGGRKLPNLPTKASQLSNENEKRNGIDGTPDYLPDVTTSPKVDEAGRRRATVSYDGTRGERFTISFDAPATPPPRHVASITSATALTAESAANVRNGTGGRTVDDDTPSCDNDTTVPVSFVVPVGESTPDSDYSNEATDRINAAVLYELMKSGKSRRQTPQNATVESYRSHAVEDKTKKNKPPWKRQPSIGVHRNHLPTDDHSESEASCVSDLSTDCSLSSPQGRMKMPLSTMRTNRTFALRRARLNSSESDSSPKLGASIQQKKPKSRPSSATDVSVRRKSDRGLAKKPEEKSLIRRDGGRYSMRVSKSTPSDQPCSTQSSEPRNASRRTKPSSNIVRSLSTNSGVKSQPSSRSNSPRSQEYNSWKRRKEYDPRRAVTEAKLRDSAVKHAAKSDASSTGEKSHHHGRHAKSMASSTPSTVSSTTTLVQVTQSSRSSVLGEVPGDMAGDSEAGMEERIMQLSSEVSHDILALARADEAEVGTAVTHLYIICYYCLFTYFMYSHLLMQINYQFYVTYQFFAYISMRQCLQMDFILLVVLYKCSSSYIIIVVMLLTGNSVSVVFLCTSTQQLWCFCAPPPSSCGVSVHLHPAAVVFLCTSTQQLWCFCAPPPSSCGVSVHLHPAAVVFLCTYTQQLWCFCAPPPSSCGVSVHLHPAAVVFLCTSTQQLWCFCAPPPSSCGVSVHLHPAAVVFLCTYTQQLWCFCAPPPSSCGVSVHLHPAAVVFLCTSTQQLWCFCAPPPSSCGVSVHLHPAAVVFLCTSTQQLWCFCAPPPSSCGVSVHLHPAAVVFLCTSTQQLWCFCAPTPSSCGVSVHLHPAAVVFLCTYTQQLWCFCAPPPSSCGVSVHLHPAAVVFLCTYTQQLWCFCAPPPSSCGVSVHLHPAAVVFLCTCTQQLWCFCAPTPSSCGVSVHLHPAAVVFLCTYTQQLWCFCAPAPSSCGVSVHLHPAAVVFLCTCTQQLWCFCAPTPSSCGVRQMYSKIWMEEFCMDRVRQLGILKQLKSLLWSPVQIQNLIWPHWPNTAHSHLQAAVTVMCHVVVRCVTQTDGPTDRLRVLLRRQQTFRISQSRRWPDTQWTEQWT